MIFPYVTPLPGGGSHPKVVQRVFQLCGDCRLKIFPLLQVSRLEINYLFIRDDIDDIKAIELLTLSIYNERIAAKDAFSSKIIRGAGKVDDKIGWIEIVVSEVDKNICKRCGGINDISRFLLGLANLQDEAGNYR